MVVGTYYGRSWVSVDNHLKPVIGDIALGFVHASPQISMVSDWGAIREIAGAETGLNSGKLDTVVMTVRAAAAHRERVLVVPRKYDRYAEQRAEEGYEEKQKRRTICWNTNDGPRKLVASCMR